MELDAQTKALLEEVNNAGNLQINELPVAEARTGLKEMSAAMDAPVCAVANQENRGIPGPKGDIPVRLYWPQNPQNSKNAALPVLVLYHGGGFALGDAGTHENMARYYCHHAKVIVVNVDYRLSPEHKFPDGVEDCYAALRWVAENVKQLGGDLNRIAVTGDSAGGNLSAVMCQLAQARNGPKIAHQILAYPVVNMTVDPDYVSRRKFAEGYFLTRDSIAWFNELYFHAACVATDEQDIRSAPIRADSFAGLPPALIITAGFDPLRDEGKHYADRLISDGVVVDYVCFDGAIHGFMSFSGLLAIGREGLDLVCKYLRENL